MEDTEVVRVSKKAANLARKFRDAQIARPTVPIALSALIELGYEAWQRTQRAPKPEAGER